METNHLSGYTTEVLERSQIEDSVWNDFIACSPQAAPYGCTWYLDVVWPGWKAIVVSEKGKMLAAMPLKISKKYGISYVFNPPFCQYVGIFFGEIEMRNDALCFALKKRLVKRSNRTEETRKELFCRWTRCSARYWILSLSAGSDIFRS